MRRAAVGELIPGMRLARAVFSERGDLMLNAEVVLTDRYIQMLKERGFFSVFVLDDDTADIHIGDLISERVRATITSDISRVFEAMQKATAPLRAASAETLQRELESGDLGRYIQEHESYSQLQRDVEDVVDDVLEANVISGMNTIRTYDSYELIHAIDTTAVAVMLGKRFGYQRQDLLRLASGCLLHDIGMVTIEPTVLRKRGRLSPEEADRMRGHPLAGYEMLRKLRPGEVLANHVAFQHHERQDGKGYPRGLSGTNRVERAAGDRGKILLDAEIVAVADVYDALGSDRPYHAAYPPDQQVAVLGKLAGAHLNREVVQHLLSLLPIYPVGAEVMVLDGEYARYRGIVVRAHREAPDRPTVRLLFDQERQRVAPIEIDLRRLGVPIACVPP